MNSVDIYIVVEGQTEQTFVRDVLAPHMAHKMTIRRIRLPNDLKR